jgi:phosphatidylglycerol:prolipoprotein diacylglycerol transferase
MFDFFNDIGPVAFEIPIGDGFPIYWYAIIIVAGIFLGGLWAAREIEKRGQDVDEFYNGLLVVVVAGYVFARLWYVFQDVYFAGNGALYDSFLDVINIRAGGVNILGGFVGAGVVGLIYARWRNLNIWHYADVAGPALLLAQAIGRWGNVINQELYGPPTGSETWGLIIEANNRIAPYNDLTQYPLDTRFHPTFFYESIALFVGFLVLVYLNRRFREVWKPGTLFGVFMVWWGLERAIIEFFRPDQPTIGSSPMTYSMVFAVLLALAGVWLMMRLNGRLPESTRNQRRRKRRVRKPKPKRNNN